MSLDDRIVELVEDAIDRKLDRILKKHAPDPLVYTVEQTATAIGLSAKSVYRLLREGELAEVRIPGLPGKRLVSKRELELYVDKCTARRETS